MAIELNGYVDVAERIRQLREKHPEAVLRPYNPAEPFRIMEIGGREFIVYVAACYRTPDDPMPAIAVAAEPAVGKTNFTRDSEVMNAETSAWGRCIVAALAADTQRVASLNEVRNRQQDAGTAQDAYDKNAPIPFPKRPDASVTASHPAGSSSAGSTGGGCSPKQVGLIKKLGREKQLTDAEVVSLVPVALDGLTVESVSELTSKQASALITFLMEVQS